MNKSLERLNFLEEEGSLNEDFFREIIRVHDPFLKVDRSISPVCTEEGIKLRPMISCARKPSEYKASDLKMYKYTLQKGDDYCFSDEVVRSLEALALMPRCVGLEDLLAIQERGFPFQQKFFPEGEILMGWGSLSLGEDGNKYFPVLFKGNPVEWEMVGECVSDHRNISLYFK